MATVSRWPTAAAVAAATAAALVLASAWNRWRWRRLLAWTERQQALLPPLEAPPEPSANALVPRQQKNARNVHDGKVPLHGAVCLARTTMTQYAVNPHSVIDERVVIAMVGLPARGKSYLSKAIVRCATRGTATRRHISGKGLMLRHFFSADAHPSPRPRAPHHLLRRHRLAAAAGALPPARPPSHVSSNPPAQVPQLCGMPVAPVQRRVASAKRRARRNRRRLFQRSQCGRRGAARGARDGDSRRCARFAFRPIIVAYDGHVDQ
jgi:hypothetical protein